jgi:L-arabinose isomerase
MASLTAVGECTGDAARARAPRVGLVSVGLGAYWEQFAGLRPELEGHARRVARRLAELGAEVVQGGLVSTPEEAARIGEVLRGADVDLLVVHLATYATSTQVVPVVQRSAVPALVIDLQPNPAMDHPRTDTAGWLAHCGVCSLPEMAAAFRRCDLEFRSVSGHLEEERAWSRIGAWVRASKASAGLRRGRFGLLGHLYPGMLDIATDPALVPAQLGGHVEILEMDDLRVRVEEASVDAVAAVLDRARATFEFDASVKDDDLAWAGRVAAGLESLVADFDLDALAYYYRGLSGGLYERLGAGMILGASLLTAEGVPCAGEYDLRTALAMLCFDRVGAGGSFTEFQALNFIDEVVEMGHDGPAHLAISDGKPLLRGLGLYHGKRGFGVSVEFSVRPGPVTILALTQRGDGRLAMIAAEGTVVPGPLLEIGNTTSRVDFGCHPGEWVDAFCALGPAHHWALGVGHQSSVLQRVASLSRIPFARVET